jgi:hypothetical protein
MDLEEALSRSRANLRLAASTSFTEPEVLALDELFRALRRGSDVRQMLRAPAMSGVQRKVQTMLGTLDRQRERRNAKDLLEAGGAIPGLEPSTTEIPGVCEAVEDGIGEPEDLAAAAEIPDGPAHAPGHE